MQFEPIVYGWVVASACLVAEHIGLWGIHWRVGRPASYVIGVVTLLIGCLVWARTAQGRVDPFEAFVAFGLISTSGGWVVIGYDLRRRLARKQQADAMKGEMQIITQHLIDQGGNNNAPTGQSNVHRGWRRN